MVNIEVIEGFSRFSDTYIPDIPILYTPKVFKDDRGYFFESYNFEDFQLDNNWVQENQSKSQKNTLRGLHLQTGIHAQAKLVRVIKGSVLDVIVDLRVGSKSFGQTYSVLLTDYNHKMLYIPRGFGHGFLSHEDDTIFHYKCDNYYKPNSESGIIWNDGELDIDWGMGVTEKDLLISEKDLKLPTLEEYKNSFEEV
jgi:dTDP-4-dehydrorhamnose 3,5-epimerase